MRTKSNTKQQSHKRDKCRNVMKEHQSLQQIVFSENEHDAPNRVIVMDDLMNEAFDSRDKEVNSMMNLLMTKLSHHNNISVLLVCHELYPIETNSVLLREQLTGMHWYTVANAQKSQELCLHQIETNSVLLREQLTGMHLYPVANAQKSQELCLQLLGGQRRKVPVQPTLQGAHIGH